jgi:hypothetical protein
MKMLQIMKKLKHELQWIGEKCTYIEQRIDAAAAKSGDICRHLQQVFLEFYPDRNEGKTDEVKWWWVERRLRQLFIISKDSFADSYTLVPSNSE